MRDFRLTALRSLLFVPADRPERWAKALASGADAVIIDLEDAVAPDARDGARAALAGWLGAGHAPVIVRINGAGTDWFNADLELLTSPGVRAVMVPKAERARDLRRVHDAAPAVALLPLIETAAGVDRLPELAGAPGVQRLVFGSIDLQLDLGIRGDDQELLLFRSQLVLASRLAQLAPPVDGACTAIDDFPALAAEARRGRRLGFGAKLCIHPRQVAIVNDAFSPDPAEIAWAERVLAAALQARGAATAVDGQMVDKPVLRRAEAVLREANRGMPE